MDLSCLMVRGIKGKVHGRFVITKEYNCIIETTSLTTYKTCYYDSTKDLDIVYSLTNFQEIRESSKKTQKQ